ncbi:MAG: ABC transporter permease [Anaerolineales bacterium]
MNNAIRSFRTAAWLGWQIESNWTDPFLFAVYSVIKPMAGAAILVVMFGIITSGNFDSPLFTYIFIGNAFYIYVAQIMTGISWAVIDDREHYRTIKYLYIAPIRITYYLTGRGAARFITGTISVAITMAAGLLFLNLELDPAGINLPALLLALAMGVVMLALLGLLLAGITLLVTHNVHYIGETVAAALYLFSGAIFPLEVLPVWLRWIGYINPIAYWLELIRRSLLGLAADAFPTFSSLSDIQLFAILFGLSVAYGVLSIFTFRRCDHIARERGLIDRVTNW